jgi:hypothetical protein
VQYEVLSEIPAKSRMFTGVPTEDQIPEHVRLRYLQLPPDIDPRIAELAGRITKKEKSAFENAALVESYLKRNYVYTPNLSWTPGPQPLSTFLFEAKAGHCEYFASSMAILLRAAGIPTRLINGFLMGEYNPVSGDYIIRQSDAHSWVEVYVPSRGWMEFDPTPPDPNAGEINLAMQIGHYIDAAEQLWNSYIIVYDFSAQQQLFRSAQESVQTAQAAMREKSGRWLSSGQTLSDRFSAWATKRIETVSFWTVLIAVFLAAAAYKHRRMLKTYVQIWRVRWGRGSANADVVEQLFYRAARLAGRTASTRRPAETWREWIFGLPDTQRRSILEKALIVFEKSKYGRLPVSASDFACLEDAIRRLKGAT